MLGSYINKLKSDSPNNAKDKTMPKAYQSADFNSAKDYFSGFDSKDIKNFYYADLTNYKSKVPGPTAHVIEGYFELGEEEWDFYTQNHSNWYEVPESRVPQISGIETSCQWRQSYSWDDKHRAKGIGGSFSLCKEKRTVFFQLIRD